jgi:hypothetical protein
MARVAIIGGGPAGLMAAEALATANATVGRSKKRPKIEIFDAMPSLRPQVPDGRQGRHEHHALRAAARFRRPLRRAPGSLRRCSMPSARALREWIAWPRHRDLRRHLGPGLSDRDEGRAAAARLAAPPARPGGAFPCPPSLAGLGRRRPAFRHAGRRTVEVEADAVMLALGGGSWARLGSDGAWVPLLPGAACRSRRCGRPTAASTWPGAYFSERFAGQPVKPVSPRSGHIASRANSTSPPTGIEGGLVYALSAPLRDALARDGQCRCTDPRPGAGTQPGAAGSRPGAAARPRFAGQSPAPARRYRRRQGGTAARILPARG